MSLLFHRVLLVVSSVEASLGFYRDLLGLTLVSDNVREGECYDQITGIRGVRVRVVYLGMGEVACLELVEYLAPRSRKRDWAMSDVGAVRVCLSCEDLAEFEARLCGEKTSGPFWLEKDGRKVARVLLLRDPDGYEVEIRQGLSA